MTPQLALLGCAHIHTPGFIKTVLARPDVKIKSVWDHHAPRGQQRADELSARFFGDVRTILDDSEIDGVIICSETDLISRRMPAFAEAEYTAGWTGPYDITSDWNPLVGPVPGYEGLYVGVGFSGHGFKLAPTIGEALAQTVLGQIPRVPIDIYSLTRFDEGKVLHGAYGIGSIS
jgi:glycine/D-amino acid oxidase-like deaminating enzyme